MHVGEHHKSQQMKLVNSVAEAVTREVMMQNQGELPWPLADEPLDSAGDVEDPVEQVDEPEDRVRTPPPRTV